MKGLKYFGTLPFPYLNIKVPKAFADLVGLNAGLASVVLFDGASTLDDEKFRQELYSGAIALPESISKITQVFVIYGIDLINIVIPGMGRGWGGGGQDNPLSLSYFKCF